MKTGTFLGRRLAAMILTVLLLICCVPGAFATDLTVDAGFYLKQSRGGTCTLTSAAMMLRRRAYLDGLSDWIDVTENSVKSTAWSGGLSHSFTYKEMRVAYATLPSNQKEKTKVLIQLLESHPEGIVLYDRNQPHAILLTDYTDGVFYCSDPAGNISAGRVPISQASISINSASCYWYVVEDHNGISNSNGKLRLEGMTYPVNVHTSTGMSLRGTVCSTDGQSLTDIEVAVLDAAGNTAQIAFATLQDGQTSWSFREVDSEIRFGELPAGSYTYMVTAVDSSGETICFASGFTVTDAGASSSTYWSVQDTDGTKLQAAPDGQAATGGKSDSGKSSGGLWGLLFG